MKHYIGIDVSKNKLDVLWLKDPENRQVKTKVFSNSENGYQEMQTWLQEHIGGEPVDIVCTMESTGIYHEPLAYSLHEGGFSVVITNPQHSKDYGKALGVKTKTDKKDSFILAHYAQAVHPSLWHPAPESVRALKQLIVRLEAVEKDHQREQNRLEKSIFAGSSEHVIKSINDSIVFLAKGKARLEHLIKDHIDQYPDLKQDTELLESIPGVGPVISRYMLALLSASDFKSAAQFAAYLGLVPVHRESGTSVNGRPRISKVGKARLRAKLYMATISATVHNPIIRKCYQDLIARGKAKMSALCAAMRKLAHICYGVVKQQKVFAAP